MDMPQLSISSPIHGQGPYQCSALLGRCQAKHRSVFQALIPSRCRFPDILRLSPGMSFANSGSAIFQDENELSHSISLRTCEYHLLFSFLEVILALAITWRQPQKPSARSELTYLECVVH